MGVRDGKRETKIASCRDASISGDGERPRAYV